MNNDPQLHLTTWAAAMRADCDRAQARITASALSCQPPRNSKHGDWPLLWQSWIDAAARGVKVEIYLAAPIKQASATTGNRATADEANRRGIACHLIPGPQLLHCKSLIVDLRTVWVGSGNFTAAACHHNHEAYMRHDSQDMAAALLHRWELIKC